MPFGVEVVTPEQALFAGPATSVVLRTSEGDLTVLDGFAALIADVESCEVRVERPDEGVLHLAVHGGFLQVDTSPGAAEGLAEGEGPIAGLSTRVTVLAGVAELAEEIDVERAEQAKVGAEARLAELGGPTRASGEDDQMDQTDLERHAAASALRRAELRLEVAGTT
jgi:F-type H+-transporting ATPase subunit epsilon